MDLLKVVSERRPRPCEKSMSTAWLAVPAMNARHTATVQTDTTWKVQDQQHIITRA